MFALLVSKAGAAAERHSFEMAEVSIGRVDSNDLCLPQLAVSRRHARMVARDGKHIFVDLKSTHGSWVNGRKLSAPVVVRETDTIVIADFALRLATAIVLRPDPELAQELVTHDAVEARLIRAITEREPGSRLVYADWLEERGDAVRAEFLRVQDALVVMSPGTDAFTDRTHQLRHLAKSIDVRWRVRVARPRLEHCEARFEVECPKEWGALESTERADVRFCQACQKSVHYVASIAEGRRQAAAGRCVAVDLRSLRWSRDLAAPYGDHVCGTCALDLGPDAGICPRCGMVAQRSMRIGMLA